MIVETNRKTNFGIYKYTKYTNYGHCDYGVYKNKNIEIYNDVKDNMKLYYVSDMFRNWLKSKLIYFVDGIKKTTRSERKNGLFLNG